MTRWISLLLMGVMAVAGLATIGHAPAAAQPRTNEMQVISSIATSQFVSLGIGKSVVIDLPADVKDVLVGNPKVVLATLRSKRRAYVTGGDVGQTNVYFFDEQGRQIGALDVDVANRAELKPPLLANTTIGAQVVDIYRGGNERVSVICGPTACTPPPEKAPPSNTMIINSNGSVP